MPCTELTVCLAIQSDTLGAVYSLYIQVLVRCYISAMQVVAREAELSASLTQLAQGQKELLEQEAAHRKVHANLVR